MFVRARARVEVSKKSYIKVAEVTSYKIRYLPEKVQLISVQPLQRSSGTNTQTAKLLKNASLLLVSCLIS